MLSIDSIKLYNKHKIDLLISFKKIKMLINNFLFLIITSFFRIFILFTYVRSNHFEKMLKLLVILTLLIKLTKTESNTIFLDQLFLKYSNNASHMSIKSKFFNLKYIFFSNNNLFNKISVTFGMIYIL